MEIFLYIITITFLLMLVFTPRPAHAYTVDGLEPGIGFTTIKDQLPKSIEMYLDDTSKYVIHNGAKTYVFNAEGLLVDYMTSDIESNINGIKVGTAYAEVKKAFGQPETEAGTIGGGTLVIYSLPTERLYFYLEDNVVKEISILAHSEHSKENGLLLNNFYADYLSEGTVY